MSHTHSQALLQPNRSSTNVFSASRFGAAALRPFKPLLHSFRNRKENAYCSCIRPITPPQRWHWLGNHQVQFTSTCIERTRLTINDLSIKRPEVHRMGSAEVGNGVIYLGLAIGSPRSLRDCHPPFSDFCVFNTLPSAYSSLAVGHQETNHCNYFLCTCLLSVTKAL